MASTTTVRVRSSVRWLPLGQTHTPKSFGIARRLVTEEPGWGELQPDPVTRRAALGRAGAGAGLAWLPMHFAYVMLFRACEVSRRSRREGEQTPALY
jgi:hypothetical protein